MDRFVISCVRLARLALDLPLTCTSLVNSLSKFTNSSKALLIDLVNAYNGAAATEKAKNLLTANLDCSPNSCIDEVAPWMLLLTSLAESPAEADEAAKACVLVCAVLAALAIADKLLDTEADSLAVF